MISDLEMRTGIILHGSHGIYDVHTDDGVLRCTLRGNLKKAFTHPQSSNKISHSSKQHSPLSSHQDKRTIDTNVLPFPLRLVIGDYVKLRCLDAYTGVIEEILPRQRTFSRQDVNKGTRTASEQTMLANLDQIVFVFSITQPEPHFGMLDRYIAISESIGLQQLICLNKNDLMSDPRVKEAAALYTQLGYTVIWTSTHTGEGIEFLRSFFKGHTTLLTGPSGAGKSSLVNAIEPGATIRTGDVNEATGKGRHTTTRSQLYPLKEGGWIADSAGIRALVAWNIPPEDVAQCFVEFCPYLNQCAYTDCLHIEEEGCAIRQAVHDRHIHERRYHSYLRIATGEER